MDKINIIDAKINYKLLNKAIMEYECATGKPPIILMNEDTKEVFIQDNEWYLKCFVHHDLKRNYSVIGKYNGNKIFIDNDLEFGEVEVR